MVDKTRNPGRPSERSGGRAGRAPRLGEPGGRPAGAGRAAGKPGMGPARPRKAAGGIDRSIVERLEAEGLLSSEGRRYFAEQAGGGAHKAAPARGGVRGRVAGAGAGRAERPERAPGARAERGAAVRGERPERGGARPERTAERPARAGRPVRGTRPDEVEALVAERLHKVMAQAGLASRRHSEELIQAGRVTVNGRVVTELGTKVVPGRDIVEVDGRRLGQAEEMIYILLNKPKGYVTTLFDPQGRPKVTDLLGEEVAQRVYPVGRLDYETEGLLLLTNDGQLANSLMHPAREIKKTYIAKVRGVPGPAKIRALEDGIELEDGPTAPAEVKLIAANGPNAATLSIRIHEGRNRQVRRMCEAVGHEVIHLKRTTLGPLHLRDLMPGQFRQLSDRELKDLKGAAGMKQPVNRGARVAAIVEQRKARTRRASGPTPYEPGEGAEAAEARTAPGPATTPSRPRAARGGAGRSAAGARTTGARSGSAQRPASGARSGSAPTRTGTTRTAFPKNRGPR